MQPPQFGYGPRPPSSSASVADPTPHLFITNAPAAYLDELRTLIQSHLPANNNNDVHVEEALSSKTHEAHYFATVALPTLATILRKALHGLVVGGGARTLVVRPAYARAPPQPTKQPLVEHLASAVPGLVLIEDFITEEEETALLAVVDAREWDARMSRRVQHYGHSFDYSTIDIVDKTHIAAAATAVAGDYTVDGTAAAALNNSNNNNNNNNNNNKNNNNNNSNNNNNNNHDNDAKKCVAPLLPPFVQSVAARLCSAATTALLPPSMPPLHFDQMTVNEYLVRLAAND
jgi:hypothetical protein